MSSNAMSHLQTTVGMWAEETFPEQNDERLIAHFAEETDELIEALVNGRDSEIRDALADLQLLLFVFGYSHGISLWDASQTKHSINQRRTWRFDPEKGYDRHVEATS